MTSLEMKVNGASIQPSANPTDQASHASAPEHHNMAVQGGHIVLVVAVIMILIYGLKVLGRVVKRAE
jgi:hypothetical protein